MSATSPSDPVMPEGWEDADRGPGLRACVIVMTVLGSLSLIARFWSRSLSTTTQAPASLGRFWLDDWLALAASPFIFGQLAVEFWVLDLGFGRHLTTIPQQDLLMILRLIFTCSVLYGFELSLARASALCFLRRIFTKAASPAWFNIILTTTQILNVAWGFGTVIAPFFMCKPIPRSWNPMLPGTCAPMNRLWMGCTIPGVVIDFIILLLPMPSIWHLQSSLSRKIGITIIFAMGYCVIVAALGRLITVVRPSPTFDTDVTYEAVPMVYWFTVDPTITLVSICLPAMLPLARLVMSAYITPMAKKLSSMRSKGSRGMTSTGESYDLSRGTASSFHRSNRRGMQSLDSVNAADLPSKSGFKAMAQDSPEQSGYNASVTSENGVSSGRGNFPHHSVRVDQDVVIIHKQ